MAGVLAGEDPTSPVEVVALECLEEGELQEPLSVPSADATDSHCHSNSNASTFFIDTTSGIQLESAPTSRKSGRDHSDTIESNQRSGLPLYGLPQTAAETQRQSATRREAPNQRLPFFAPVIDGTHARRRVADARVSALERAFLTSQRGRNDRSVTGRMAHSQHLRNAESWSHPFSDATATLRAADCSPRSFHSESRWKRGGGRQKQKRRGGGRGSYGRTRLAQWHGSGYSARKAAFERRNAQSSSQPFADEFVETATGEMRQLKDTFEKYCAADKGGQLLAKKGWDSDWSKLTDLSSKMLSTSQRNSRGLGFGKKQKRTINSSKKSKRKKRKEKRREYAQSSAVASSTIDSAFVRPQSGHLPRLSMPSSVLDTSANTKMRAKGFLESVKRKRPLSETVSEKHSFFDKYETQGSVRKKRRVDASAEAEVIDLLDSDSESDSGEKAAIAVESGSRNDSQSKKTLAHSRQKSDSDSDSESGSDNDSSSEVQITGEKRPLSAAELRRKRVREIVAKQTLDFGSAKQRVAASFGAAAGSSEAEVTVIGDGEVMCGGRQSVSRRDPYSQCLIEIPVRSTFCAHLDCFDLYTFLSKSARFRNCDYCGKRLTEASLFCDSFVRSVFDEIQSQFGDDVDRVVFHIAADGCLKWHPDLGVLTKSKLGQMATAKKETVSGMAAKSPMADGCSADVKRDAAVGLCQAHASVRLTQTADAEIICLSDSESDFADSENEKRLKEAAKMVLTDTGTATVGKITIDLLSESESD